MRAHEVRVEAEAVLRDEVRMQRIESVEVVERVPVVVRRRRGTGHGGDVAVGQRSATGGGEPGDPRRGLARFLGLLFLYHSQE